MLHATIGQIIIPRVQEDEAQRQSCHGSRDRLWVGSCHFLSKDQPCEPSTRDSRQGSPPHGSRSRIRPAWFLGDGSARPFPDELIGVGYITPISKGITWNS